MAPARESYLTGGGGFVGIHSATDTEYDWPFYETVIGAYFAALLTLLALRRLLPHTC